ncbi:site-specific integrase [Aeromonas veronii]|uniref:site-specific integrase n=1 Tax=Aeromonas veronii TaxID=654 RepID=UPI003308A69E|nr:hypothetical protein [Aeromonas veronii]
MIPNNPLSTLVQEQIPAKANGYSFMLLDTRWWLDKNNAIPVGMLHGLLEPEALRGSLNTLSFYARNWSAAHTRCIFWCFLDMIRATRATHINDFMLISYRSSLDTENEHQLGPVSVFLKQWYRLGYPGVSKDVVCLLNGWRIKGRRKGDAVKRMDPQNGPLTDNELQAFNEGAVRAYEENLISITELAMAFAISHTGRRSIQISQLRVVDILCGENEKGEPFYILNVPRAKQRGNFFRESFKSYAMTQELWAILSALARDSIAQVKKILGFELQEADWPQIPLFPDLAVVATIKSSYEFRQLLTTDKLHIASAEITGTLQLIVEKSDIRSERTGELLNINARRFRYTTGTRAAREGFGELVIAELLDHSDTQNAGVYVKNIPEHVKKLDEAVGFQLAAYAQAFAGVLVDSERDAQRGNDPSSRIRTEMGQGVGTCGEHGFCGANVPIPCYTCIHFQPWLDGPHDDVYQSMLDERERLKEITGDIQIAAVLDRSILAVADVIIRCEKRREELGEHGAVTNG